MLKNYNVILLFIASVIALSVAYIAQYFFMMLPCKLCIYERIPYFMVIGLSCIYLFRQYNIVFFCMCLCYIINIIISGYHIALEHNWVKDVIGCTDDIQTLTFDDLKNSLLNTNVRVSCGHPSMMFIGLSMAECNFIYCILCLMISVYLFVKQCIKQENSI